MAVGCVLIAAFAALIYLLHRQGFAVTKRITAILFVFRSGRHGDSASLNSCTGWVRHRGRFRQSGLYEFHLDCRLSRGSAEIILSDSQKRELLRLNRENRTGSIELDGSGRYSLCWEFQNATGTCALHW